MKWWVFNQDQLDAALSAYFFLDTPAGEAPRYRYQNNEVFLRVVREFLDSPEAQAHKLRGDK